MVLAPPAVRLRQLLGIRPTARAVKKWHATTRDGAGVICEASLRHTPWNRSVRILENHHDLHTYEESRDTLKFVVRVVKMKDILHLKPTFDMPFAESNPITGPPGHCQASIYPPGNHD